MIELVIYSAKNGHQLLPNGQGCGRKQTTAPVGVKNNAIMESIKEVETEYGEYHRAHVTVQLHHDSH